MRYIFIFLILLDYATSEGQMFKDSVANKLYKEISKETFIPHKYIGCYGGISSSYNKIDSLRNILGTYKFVTLIDDKNYSLKYWAYVTLLQNNDSLAFNYLKEQIKNDTLLSLQYEGNRIRDEYKFNELLIDWYSCVIQQKYKDGISGTINNVVIVSNGKNLKKWKELNSNLNKLLVRSGITLPLKKINCF